MPSRESNPSPAVETLVVTFKLEYGILSFAHSSSSTWGFEPRTLKLPCPWGSTTELIKPSEFRIFDSTLLLPFNYLPALAQMIISGKKIAKSETRNFDKIILHQKASSSRNVAAKGEIIKSFSISGKLFLLFWWTHHYRVLRNLCVDFLRIHSRTFVVSTLANIPTLA